MLGRHKVHFLYINSFGDVNQGTEDLWVNLEESDPMELEDKWGKKCPPQYALKINDQ